jgi:hypothetical protein
LIAAAFEFPRRSPTLFLGGLYAVLAVSIFWYTNILIRTRFKQKARLDEARLSSRLTNGSWILVYNPDTLGRKEIMFVADGTIGIGHNENEHRWRIREGTLEILNSSGNVFSRFRFNEPKNFFEHTNDADTLSLRNQKIVRPQTTTNDGYVSSPKAAFSP